ncbi:galactose-1-epimerase [Marinoscillum furvescens]|uniref:Aldose 1-epimerase n=1 Tax=Marinoscillum furvescens DSM 4134 TaxID=1122208 RepID=A0A3D9L4R5_MARFU|nr:galactose-1-epimerase [Marinoscillum furvescens]RED97920.1 aldose 1-epimerase [Marinoscillum furvescens DSM 4134]
MKQLNMHLFTLIILFLVLAGCTNSKKTNESHVKTAVQKELFGILDDGTKVFAYTLTNANGFSMKVISYGGIITSIKTPDRKGNFDDIVLGYDDLEGYLEKNPYFGALIGRFGNRIAGGQFTLEGKTYTLATNDGNNHLHGGERGFDKVVWELKEAAVENGVAVTLEYLSPAMEEGYPGNLDVKVQYTLTNDNELIVDYHATSDQTTIVNLTQHTYFNLTGRESDILDHELMINAQKFLPVDSTLIPTGELRSVQGTPFDFTSFKRIGKDINADNQQIAYGLGFDHCWAIDQEKKGLNLAAAAFDAKSGRQVSVYTTEPGIQFYSGNFLDGTITGKGGKNYGHRSGFCLETQHFPNSPNQPDFPEVVLRAGDVYKSTTKYVFITKS